VSASAAVALKSWPNRSLQRFSPWTGAPLELVVERMGHANRKIALGVYRQLLQHEHKGWVIDREDLLKNVAGLKSQVPGLLTCDT
jgi:hypothetical protein